LRNRYRTWSGAIRAQIAQVAHVAGSDQDADFRHRREMRMLTKHRSAAGALSLVAAAGLALAGCGNSGSSASPSSPSGKVTLTFWENYGTQLSLLNTAKNLIHAYEKLHPNVTIKMVSQPANNYFALLQASAISHTGPDLAVMWTGLYLPPYASIMADVRPYIPPSVLNNVEGLQWGAQNFNASKPILAMPVDAQFYMGFYNKKDFAKAGIKQVPQDWNQLYAACGALKKVGITPIVYGSASASYTGEFNPWYDFSYLMIGALKPSQWAALYSGSIAWNSPLVQAQLAHWHELFVKGCVNTDALTDSNNLGQFVSGKAAMTTDDGSWDVGQFTQQMGSNVGAMVPPFSTAPQHGVVYFPGDAISVMKESPNIPAAAKFLAFMDSPAGATQIAAAGLIPDIKNFNSTNTLNSQMLGFVKSGYTVYPMLDNVTQPEIVNVGYQVLPALLVGQTSVGAAVGSMMAKHNELPLAHRSSYAAYFG
jgi:raffinose/stachyose/melibiose transport system substrate-binding protein